jgi:hypothetical protein
MISKDRARRIARGQDPADLVRAAWRAAGYPPGGGVGLDAAVGLDLETGDLRLVAWATDEEPP